MLKSKYVMHTRAIQVYKKQKNCIYKYERFVYAVKNIHIYSWYCWRWHKNLLIESYDTMRKFLATLVRSRTTLQSVRYNNGVSHIFFCILRSCVYMNVFVSICWLIDAWNWNWNLSICEAFVRCHSVCAYETERAFKTFSNPIKWHGLIFPFLWFFRWDLFYISDQSSRLAWELPRLHAFLYACVVLYCMLYKI